MSVAFYKGQVLGREDLNIFFSNSSNRPVNAAEISYAIYDFTTGMEALVGIPRRAPANPSMGEYYASIIIPLDANMGNYRIRWTFRESFDAPIQQVVQEFEVIDKVTSTGNGGNGGFGLVSTAEAALMQRLRILLRDNNPDRNYHFRPPAHEETVRQFNRVFGNIWEDSELQEYLATSLDMISSAPPRTPFANVDQLVALRPDWRTLLLTGAMMWAINALRLNWIADEFSYSIGGVSLDLEKSSKYEGAYSAATEQFDKQMEKAKATVNVILGLQQPKFGTGIRSSFGPYVGAGVLTPRKFMGGG